MHKGSGHEGQRTWEETQMRYLGIDVAKQTLECSLLDPATGKLRTKRVSNDPAGYAALVAWLSRQGVSELAELHTVLEATGVYHETAASWLHAAGAQVSVVNPAQVKDFARGLAVRTKTDRRDSGVLARYGALVQPRPWQPPAPAVRELQALLARVEALETDLRRERNRQEKAAATATPALIVESLANGVRFLADELARLRQAIDDHIDRHPDLKADRERLQSIPAVGTKTATRLLAVLRSRSFQRAEQVAAFLGLVPVEHQSGSSVAGRPHLSKAGNPRLRAALYMAAVVAVRFNPDVKALYERLLARGKSKMAALGAAMRKLVHLCFGVLKHQANYEPNWTPPT
jgi:transposase